LRTTSIRIPARPLFAAATLAALTALAGCGSSSPKAASTGATVTATTSAPSTLAATVSAATQGAKPKNGKAASPPAASATAPQTSQAAPVALGIRVENVQVPGIGMVLADSRGHVLYTFAPDNHTKVTCTHSCAIVWPPLKVPPEAATLPAGEVSAELLKSAPDPEGGRVVTYKGWPLYLYAGDTEPETAKGQALNINGGLWYVISPTGHVITKSP
jgi:predicted lipoprotein with Yx(FWY)xxD motif